jgi:hypothetical protein
MNREKKYKTEGGKGDRDINEMDYEEQTRKNKEDIKDDDFFILE